MSEDTDTRQNSQRYHPCLCCERVKLLEDIDSLYVAEDASVARTLERSHPIDQADETDTE